MSAPEHGERFVLAWARRYTRGLPVVATERRLAELRSDCHEQRTWASEVGARPATVALSTVARTLAGLPADLLWRHTQLATVRDRSLRARGRPMGRWTRDNWWLVLAGLTGTFLVLLGVGLPFEDRTLGSVIGGSLTALAGVVMLAGLAVRRRRRVVGDIMVGLPAFALVPWVWTIVLPLVALAVMIPAFRDAADAASTGEAPGPARPA